MPKLQLRTNVPEVIALQFAQGKEVESNFNGTQILYSLADGRSWYVHPSVARKVDALSLGKGEPFEVTKCKCESPTGKGWFTYEVKHFTGVATHPTPAPQAVQSPRNGTPAEVGPLQTNSTPAPNSTGGALMGCFMAAIDAVAEAQAYATRRGLGITFSAEDVRATAISAYIGMQKGGR